MKGRRIVHGLVLTLLLVGVAGCRSRQTVHEPARYIVAERPSRMWVEGETGLVEVTGPRLFGDTLVGFFNGQYREVSVTQFDQVQVERLDAVKTGLLVGGIAVGIGLASAALWGGGEHDFNIENPENDESRVARGFRLSRALIPLLRIPAQ